MLKGLTQLERLPDGLGVVGQSRASSAEGDLGSDACQNIVYVLLSCCFLSFERT